MNRPIRSLLLAAVWLAVALPAFTHCEVPCGIYDDEMRLRMISEHITTIEKAMRQVAELAAADNQNFNQIVRWTNTKETHASEIQHIVSQYFMTQRVKPKGADDAKAYAKYVEQLTLLHGMLIQAMKAKQTLDPTHVTELRSLLEKFSLSYLGHKLEP